MSDEQGAIPEARKLIADVFRSWDMRRQADAYEAGSYDDTLPVQALATALTPKPPVDAGALREIEASDGIGRAADIARAALHDAAHLQQNGEGVGNG